MEEQLPHLKVTILKVVTDLGAYPTPEREVIAAEFIDERIRKVRADCVMESCGAQLSREKEDNERSSIHSFLAGCDNPFCPNLQDDEYIKLNS